MGLAAFNRVRRIAKMREEALLEEKNKALETEAIEAEEEVEDIMDPEAEEAEEAEVAEEEDFIDYDKTRVAELKILLDGKGIEYNAKARKEELFELLEGAE